MDEQPLVGILMGSTSDLPVMIEAVKVLKELDIPCEVNALSAHRTPTRVAEYATTAAERGLGVLIAGAGGAAHLGGVLAAHTSLPVIGVPVLGKSLDGLDSLLPTVQMPPGVPVACVGIGEAGAKNAALLAVQILAGADARLADRYAQFKEDQARSIEDKNRALQKRIRS